MTVLGGKVVHAAGDFRKYSPPALPVSPNWSPVRRVPGYHVEEDTLSAMAMAGVAAGGGCGCGCGGAGGHARPSWVERIPFGEESLFWDSIGCNCWL
jgi:hypothetical protein